MSWEKRTTAESAIYLHTTLPGWMEGALGDIERLTEEGIAEGYRLACEAREAIRSRYEDWMLITILFGLVLWAAMLVVIVAYSPAAIGPWALLASLATVTAVLVPLLLLCRSRFRPLLAEQDRWMSRLSVPRSVRGASSFDLLVEISLQVPVWLSIKEKNRFKAHPFLSTAIFLSLVSAVYISVITAMHLGDSSFPYLLIMLLPFLALLIASVRAEVKAVHRDREMVLARWKARADSSRQAMEEILGGP